LVRVPRIEEEIRGLVTGVFDALRNSDDMILPVVGANLRDDVMILARDFWRVRKCLRIRRCFGVASGKGYFPPDVMCRSILGRTITAKESALPGSPLTSKLPASKYRCSWDLQAGAVINLVVPDDGLNALFSDLKASRFCGVKLAYLYSGKMMLLYDLLIALVAFVLLASCEHGQAVLKDHAIWSAFLTGGSKVLVAIMVLFLGKLVVWDIGHWIPSWGRFIRSLRAANDTAADIST
jgi:hypothetical protein